MKKFLICLAFALAPVALRAAPVSYVQISTTSKTQSGGFHTSTGTVDTFTSTTAAITNYTGTASTVTRINTTTLVAASATISGGTVSASTITSTSISGSTITATSSATLSAATINSLKGTLGANFAAGGFKFTGLAAGSTAGDSARYEQLSPGKILQIVSVSTANAQKTSTSASYADTGLSTTFTATLSTSKVFVVVSQTFGATSAASTVCTARILMDASEINLGSDPTVFVDNATTESDGMVSLYALNTPGDTSSHTYKTTFARTSGSGTCIVNTTVGSNTGNAGAMYLFEIGQ